jgi:calcineurin-like phosphoesterase family protein
MALVQFNVSVGEKTHLVHLKESAGVDELFRVVCEKCANGVSPEDIRLVFGDVELEYNKNKRFKDYSLVHLSTLTLLVRVHGGGNSESTQQEPTA